MPQYEYDDKDNKRVLPFEFLSVELKQGGMSGSYS
jgi:hypothetical protein